MVSSIFLLVKLLRGKYPVLFSVEITVESGTAQIRHNEGKFQHICQDPKHTFSDKRTRKKTSSSCQAVLSLVLAPRLPQDFILLCRSLTDSFRSSSLSGNCLRLFCRSSRFGRADGVGWSGVGGCRHDSPARGKSCCLRGMASGFR